MYPYHTTGINHASYFVQIGIMNLPIPKIPPLAARLRRLSPA
jgi:hypothetical protein